MEAQRKPARLWTALSVILVLCTIFCIWYGMHSSVTVLLEPKVLAEASGEVLECIRSGDFETLSRLLSGTPRMHTVPDDEGAKGLLWKAYLESIRYEFPGTYTPAGDAMELDVRIECMDLSAALDSVLERAPALAKEHPDQYPNQDTIISDAMRDAALEVLAAGPQTTNHEMTMQLVRADGRWQVVPTPELQQLMSGLIAQ